MAAFIIGIIIIGLAVHFLTEYWKIVAAVVVCLLLIIFIISSRRRRALKRQAAAQAEAEQIKRERARREAAEAERRAQEARAEQARLAREQEEKAEREKAQQAMTEPFSPPEAQQGFVLVYSYDDVAFEYSDELMAKARAVPPHKQLTIQFLDDDENIGIYYQGELIGRMLPGKLRDMAGEFGEAEEKEALVVSQPWTDKPVLSLYLYLHVDELARRWVRNPSFKKCTLTGNTNENMQASIDLAEPGETVSIDFDYDKEKYLVSAHGDIGYLPANMDEYMSEHPNVEARILSITEKDSGKSSVTVMMIEKE